MRTLAIILIAFLFTGLIFAQNWQAKTISQNCTGDVMRSMSVGVYDMNSNRTFITYIGPAAAIYVAQCNHNNNNNWTSDIKVGDNPTTLSAKYSYPQIIQTPDGYLHVFYVKHTAAMYYAKSINPGDASQWTTPVELSISSNVPGYRKLMPSYPNAIMSRSGDMYLFWRQDVTDNTRPLYYSVSKDYGKSWAPAKEALIPIRPDNMNEIYLGQIVIEPKRVGVPERFHLPYMLAGGQGHNDGHKDIYHTIFQPSDGNFYSMDGTNLGANVDATEMYKRCLVEDTGSPNKLYPGYYHYVGISDKGEVIVDGRFRWNGTKYVPFTPSGLNIADGLTYIEWENGRFLIYGDRVEVYQSLDLGNTWSVYGKSALPVYNSQRSNRSLPMAFPAHPAAKVWSKENAPTEINCIVSVVSQTPVNKPQKIYLTATRPSLDMSESCTIRAFITDSINARQTTATNAVKFEVVGGGQISTTQKNAVNGLADIMFTAPSKSGIVIIKASGTGLKSEYIELFVGDAIYKVPTAINSPSTHASNTLVQGSLQCYPNPIRTNASLSFNLFKPATVQYSIIDALGRTIYTSQPEVKESGHNTLIGVNIEKSGLYFVSLTAGSDKQVLKIQKR